MSLLSEMLNDIYAPEEAGHEKVAGLPRYLKNLPRYLNKMPRREDDLGYIASRMAAHGQGYQTGIRKALGKVEIDLAELLPGRLARSISRDVLDAGGKPLSDVGPRGRKVLGWDKS